MGQYLCRRRGELGLSLWRVAAPPPFGGAAFRRCRLGRRLGRAAQLRRPGFPTRSHSGRRGWKPPATGLRNVVRGSPSFDRRQTRYDNGTVGPEPGVGSNALGRFHGVLLPALVPGAVTLRGVCELRRLIRRCARPAAGACQYCGRAFCGGHGVLLDDGQEICGRSRCQRKRVDLERHLRYKAFVRERNAGGQCGVPGCETRLSGQCSRCHGFFCGRHLLDRHVSVRQGRAWVQRPASMCDHCWRRRPLWSQL